MRRLCLLAALLLLGCGNVVGPFGPRSPQRVDDPFVSIDEQERRGRDRYALPDEQATRIDNLAPRTYIDRPGPHGR
ncbi:MAG TPA: hypothetical protein VKI65_21230 [Gemmataceae bacterium]|nr:hypothetical protein [Gemmataceae bacterium]